MHPRAWKGLSPKLVRSTLRSKAISLREKTTMARVRLYSHRAKPGLAIWAQ
jgi:hypothetical protein